MYYITPNIPTDDPQYEMVQPVQLPAPGMPDLARTINGYIDTSAEPIHQHVRAFNGPHVPWHSGWAFPNIDFNAWARRAFPFPMQAPQISYGTGGYVPAVAKAVHPDPTVSYIGVPRMLRAPGINEGYTL